MSNLRLLTSGESHGKVALAVIEGFPAGVEIDAEKINLDLRRRQAGYGRGQRMKIEKDQVEFLSGVRKGESIGAPITLAVWNKDSRLETTREVDKPRPGHSDLAGYLKYNTGIRNILERASARETVARVAAGSLAQLLLREFGIEIYGHVTRIGPAAISDELDVTYEMMRAADLPDGGGEVRCVHEPTAQQMVAAIEQAKKDRDTLGGTIEIIVTGLPAGLGSHVQWDRKLDGRIAQAVISIQAMKAIEIGLGTRAAALPGSQVHDPIRWDAEMNRQPGSGGYWRGQNGSGGTEGGMSTGAPLVVRATMKPISTLMDPLPSVNINSKEPDAAAIERSDVCSVPAASVVVENVIAFVVADAFLEKFGGDSLAEIRRNHEAYLNYLKSR